MTVKASGIAYVQFSRPREGDLAADELRFAPVDVDHKQPRPCAAEYYLSKCRQLITGIVMRLRISFAAHPCGHIMKASGRGTCS